MEKTTGEKIEIHGDDWGAYSFNIQIRSDFFLRLLETFEFQEGEVSRFAGVPYEIFNANDEAKRDFLKGIGDCCGEVDRYLDGRARVVLRFLNENVRIIEDVVELLVRLAVDIFDVNLSPPSKHRQELSSKIDELTNSLTSRYLVNVTGRQERVGRDNMIRMWGEEYYQKIGFYHPLRHGKLLKYL